MRGLLEGGAYFKVDTQRCGAYKKLVLIRADMMLLGLVQLYFYCTFFDTTFLYLPYPAEICVFKFRAEIRTWLLIHIINCEVSGMILYVISNPKFLGPSFTNFPTKY